METTRHTRARSERAAIVVTVAFPTDFLSVPAADDPKVTWLPPAPPHEATFVGIALTRETEQHARTLWESTGGYVPYAAPATLGETLLVLVSHDVWANEDLIMPGPPEDRVFAKDDAGTGRPIRICLGGPGVGGKTLRLTELGGYARRSL